MGGNYLKYLTKWSWQSDSVSPYCKEPKEFDFMISYVLFFSSIALCLKVLSLRPISYVYGTLV